MHTADTPSPASGPLGFLKSRRFMQSEDTMIATLAAWTVGLLIFTLAGFYIGTVAGHDNHQSQLPNVGPSIVTSAAPTGSPWREPGMALHKDLDPIQLQSALPFALGGLLLGLAFALWITFAYTPAKLRELEREQGHH